MNLPSVKTLKAVTSYPRELRQVLEASFDELWRLAESDKPFKRSQFTRFHAQVSTKLICSEYFRMLLADELCETCGVEHINRGHNYKSPPITYCNAGDPYTTTLLWVDGRYRVGCWGDYVERGNYD